MGDKIYRKRCEICGKEIKSLNQFQCNHNFEVHQISCKKKLLKEVNGNVSQKSVKGGKRK